MKITQIETVTAQHLPGVGTLPVSFLIGKGAKYPNLKLEEVAPIGVKVTINNLSMVVPWSQIKKVCVENEKNS